MNPGAPGDHRVASVASLTRDVAGAKTLSVPCYVYILHCADGQNYYGSSGDLSRRLAEHREGLHGWTAPRRPLRLVYFEEHETTAQARRRERGFKNGRTHRKTIERLIADFPGNRLVPFA